MGNVYGEVPHPFSDLRFTMYHPHSHVYVKQYISELKTVSRVQSL